MKVKECIVAVLLAFVLTSFSTGRAYCDTALDEQSMISGVNIYAPTVIRDGTVYKLWYGGWQDGGFNDQIYFRTSTDNVYWSPPLTVLTPADISPTAVHVNDPSVTLVFDPASKEWQYTMFYTVCMQPCNQSDNQIWSSVSSNGADWIFHQPLLTSTHGSAEPSAVAVMSEDATWKVYYVDRDDASKVKMVKVGADRKVASGPFTVYENAVLTLSGAEVRQIGSSWTLFFNSFFADHVDIYKSVSASNEQWPSTFSTIISKTGPLWCAAMTPGVLPASATDYDLYYGLTPRAPGGECNLAQQQSIQRSRFRITP